MARPPYIDPRTGFSYGCSDPDFSGFLTKQSVWLRDWRRRFFILKGSKLFFAKNEYVAPHGMIDLSTCMTVKSAEQKTHKRHAFEISTQDTTFFMYAATEKQKDDWIGAVGRSIVQSSSTYQGEEVDDDSSDNEYNYR
ncbi:unnamed protein product [Chrysoparadoxa australica]